MNVVTVYDCIAANLGKFPIPPGILLAGYDTEAHPGDGIAWSPEQFAAHPGSLHIDQDPAASDYTADYLDVEAGAVPVGSHLIAEWYHRTFTNWLAGTRPGQRHPAVYQSAVNVTPNVNALITAGITSGPGLIVADWNLSEPMSVADVQNASGPFPIVGVQFRNSGPFDVNVMSGTWLSAVSPAPVTPPPPPLPTGSQDGWRWCHLCGGAFYGPTAAHIAMTSCPARRGPHDPSQSGKYRFTFTPR